MHTATLLVLANSWKRGGRCVAGRRVSIAGTQLTLGEWVRPVAPPSGTCEGELLDRHCETSPGRQVRVLDVVQVPLRQPAPKPGQPENHEIVADKPWRRLGSVGTGSIRSLAEAPSGLWDLDPNRTDRVAASDIERMSPRNSLVVIQPRSFRVKLRPKDGRMQWRGCFSYGSHEYDLSLTDDTFREDMASQTGSATEFVPAFKDRCLLCISLGGAFGDYHYKLVAAVIREPK